MQGSGFMECRHSKPFGYTKCFHGTVSILYRGYGKHLKPQLTTSDSFSDSISLSHWQKEGKLKYCHEIQCLICQ